MAGIAVNDVIRVTYFCRLFSQRVLTVFHLRCATAPTGSDILTQLTNLANSCGGTGVFPLQGWLPLVGAELNFDEVRCQKVYPARTLYAKAAIGATGSHSDPCKTANVAVSVEKRTIHPGRKGIGRIQMAGIPASTYTDGSLDSSYLTAILSHWTDLDLSKTPATGGGSYKWCLFGGSLVTSDDDIIQVQPQTTLRVMRRRTVGVGK